MHIVFTTQGFYEITIESWLGWDLNPQPLNKVDDEKRLILNIMFHVINDQLNKFTKNDVSDFSSSAFLYVYVKALVQSDYQALFLTRLEETRSLLLHFYV